jgi:hypothetical protein
MCFSPEADLTTGVIVGVIGVDAIRHASRPQQMALAALPVLLAAHEIDEALVWWGLRGQLPAGVTHAAIYIFLTVAFALPFLVPLATLGIEPVMERRRVMGALLVVGAGTTVALLLAVVGAPVGAAIDGQHIAYTAQISYGTLLVCLYVLATCGSLLVASSRLLRLFGLCNLGAVIGVSWLTFTGFTSLWCAWAALTSIAIAVYLRQAEQPAPALPLPASA